MSSLHGTFRNTHSPLSSLTYVCKSLATYHWLVRTVQVTQLWHAIGPFIGFWCSYERKNQEELAAFVLVISYLVHMVSKWNSGKQISDALRDVKTLISEQHTIARYPWFKNNAEKKLHTELLTQFNINNTYSGGYQAMKEIHY